MKKKALIISIICIVLGILLFCYMQYTRTQEALEECIEASVNAVLKIRDAIDRYDYPTMGQMHIDAKYKGAHGENFPVAFSYIFHLEKKTGKLTLENEKGSIDSIVNMDFYYKLESLKPEEFIHLISIKRKIVKGNTIRLILDEKRINSICNTNYKEAQIIVHLSGIFKKHIKTIEYKLDDIKAEYKEDNLLITSGKNHIKVRFNEKGYSLNINDILKMNTFYKKDFDQYNIVIEDAVYYLELHKDKVLFKTSTQADIYNGLDIEIKFQDVHFNLEKKLEVSDVPVLRYFQNTHFEVWRKNHEK